MEAAFFDELTYQILCFFQKINPQNSVDNL
jgi:hypothetical protein